MKLYVKVATPGIRDYGEDKSTHQSGHPVQVPTATQQGYVGTGSPNCGTAVRKAPAEIHWNGPGESNVRTLRE